MFSTILVPFVALLAALPVTFGAPSPASVSERGCVTDEWGNAVYCGSAGGLPAILQCSNSAVFENCLNGDQCKLGTSNQGTPYLYCG